MDVQRADNRVLFLPAEVHSFQEKGINNNYYCIYLYEYIALVSACIYNHNYYIKNFLYTQLVYIIYLW